MIYKAEQQQRFLAILSRTRSFQVLLRCIYLEAMKKLALFTCLIFTVVIQNSEQMDVQSSGGKRYSSQTFASRLYNSFFLGGQPSYPLPQYYKLLPGLEEDLFDGRQSSLHLNPYTYPFRQGNVNEALYQEARLNGLGINALNNIFFNNRVLSLDSCTGADSGETGVCATSAVCSVFGGTASGSCSLGRVCCINSVSGCDKTITVNNTYWQSPTTGISTPSTCSLTIKVDSKLVEQSKSICQVRLDFTDFTAAQPSAIGGTSRGVCDIDTFEVVGATNAVPTICGDNGGQHMYLTITNSGTQATNLKLKFTFNNKASVTRSWKIKAALLPCYSDYLAPDGCLQYFTTTSGTVSSFNFKDTTSASRKLANQDYNICFRNEVVSGQQANQLCLEECTVSDGNDAYRISANGDVSQLVDLLGFCQRDYLVFVGGTNSDGLSLDRFCGGAFNSASISAKASVCSKMTPFKISFRTDGTEVVSVAADPSGPTDEVIGDDLNVGFCLKFSQKVVSS